MPEFRTNPSRSETGVARVFTALALTAAIAGCAAPSGMRAISNAEPTFSRLTEERVFAQALRQRYLELATNAYDRGDLERSDFYSLRAIMAVEGKLVDPAGGASTDTDALSAARIRIGERFSNGARLGSPDLAARAQAAYDCWWLETQHGGDATIAAACSTNTVSALTELDVIGTGSRLADARIGSQVQPYQVVVNGQTPSQTIDAGGAMVEIINQPADSHTAPGGYADTVIATRPIGAPMQQRAALARTVPPVAPMQSHSARPFVVDAPVAIAPPPIEPVQATMLYSGVEESYDIVIPTVPVPDPVQAHDSFAPIDLVPRIETVPLIDEPVTGGQYVPLEQEHRAEFTMQPIYEDAMPEPPRYAAVATPVYTDTIQQTVPMAPAPVMMEHESGDVLSTLIDARADSRSDYAVYFGFDSDEITLEGQDVLGDTLEALALEDRDTLALVGFTDSVGDSRYNQLLAMRRANAVRQFIQQRSSRPIRFEIMPVGEAEAVQQGGDGVTEALNRRVEIILR